MKNFFSFFLKSGKNNPNNGYKKIISTKNTQSSCVVSYHDALLSDAQKIESHDKSDVQNETPNSKSLGLEKNHYDFRTLIAKSRFANQQKVWNEQFQKSATDMIYYYARSISDSVKENKDLQKIFYQLDVDLEKVKMPRESFVKKLIIELQENKVSFSEQLKKNLQLLIMPNKNKFSFSINHADNISKERTYSLEKGNKSTKSCA